MNEQGISVGWFLTFAQVYVNEVAPAHLRGIVFSVYQIQLSTGSIVGAAVDYGTHNMPGKESYQIPLAIFFFAPTVQSIALYFFPESPRWLMTQGRTEDAEASLRRLRNPDIKESEFQAEFNEIRVSTAEQIEQNTGRQLWIEMWKGTDLRRTLLSVAIICFHCANGQSYPILPAPLSLISCVHVNILPGSSWLNIYTTYFLDIAGVEDAFAYSTMVSCMGLLGVISSLFFVRYLDRRMIVMLGVGACGLCQLAFAVAWSAAPETAEAAKAVIAFMSIFTFSYVAYGKHDLPKSRKVHGRDVNECSTLRLASWR